MNNELNFNKFHYYSVVTAKKKFKNDKFILTTNYLQSNH